MSIEVKVSEKQLQALWAKTEWNDPFDSYVNNDDALWEFLYLTERCPAVLKTKYPSITCDNEDANDILNLMTNFWRSSLIDDYINAHKEEVHEAFNVWWWSNHDVTDYLDDEEETGDENT